LPAGAFGGCAPVEKFFLGMLAEGIYLAPSQFESGFISTAHSPADREKTVSAAAKVLRGL
jgi:glutamate-1-semialdehyde 2,1-aminomutase